MTKKSNIPEETIKRSDSQMEGNLVQCIQANNSKTLDKRSTLILEANCTEQKLSSSESYYTLPRIYKVEMEHASLLFHLAKPQSGGVLGCDLRHCTSEPFDFRRFVEACRAYGAWSRCCRSACRCSACAP